MKTNKHTKSTFNAMGFYCVSQYGGYIIEINDCNFTARIKPDFNSPTDRRSRPKWQTIKEDKNGVLFVTYYGQKMALDNFKSI